MRPWVTILAALVLVTSAHAQSTGPPTYSVGDTWKRSNGLEITVIKVEENGVQMAGFLRTCPTCVYHFDKNLTILNATQADGKPLDVTQHGFIPLGSDWRFLDFPLEVKKTWRISPQGWFRGSPARYTVDFTVVAYEDVKTKAGTFKAYKIQQEWATITPLRGDPIRWSSVLWFAPDVKLSVKFTTTGRGETQDWELTSYGLK